MTKMDRVAFLQWAQPQMGFKCSGFRKVHGQVCKRCAGEWPKRAIGKGLKG